MSDITSFPIPTTDADSYVGSRVDSRLSSVKSFGVMGDGVTDDWQAFTDAVASTPFGAAPPTSGEYAQGDIRFNTDSVPGGKVGWVCTAGGTPGTWNAFGEIPL